MSYDAIIDRFFDYAKTFEGEVILRMRDVITGKIFTVRVKKSAVKELYRMVEASKRENYQEAVAIVQSAKSRFERFLQEIGKEYMRQRKFGDFVVHYYIPPSRMMPGNAVFFVPRVVLEDEAKRRKEVANSPAFNPSGYILSVIAAAATHEALEEAENFFQIYDVSAGKKGNGYDSPLVIRFFEVTYSLIFKRGSWRNSYILNMGTVKGGRA
jgi:mRNA-degrading endonuclease RelE of RelBE toxin-antitoxin system